MDGKMPYKLAKAKMLPVATVAVAVNYMVKELNGNSASAMAMAMAMATEHIYLGEIRID